MAGRYGWGQTNGMSDAVTGRLMDRMRQGITALGGSAGREPWSARRKRLDEIRWSYQRWRTAESLLPPSFPPPSIPLTSTTDTSRWCTTTTQEDKNLNPTGTPTRVHRLKWGEGRGDAKRNSHTWHFAVSSGGAARLEQSLCLWRMAKFVEVKSWAPNMEVSEVNGAKK